MGGRNNTRCVDCRREVKVPNASDTVCTASPLLSQCAYAGIKPHARAPKTPARQDATPHPFPYQGSKRAISRHILPYIPDGADLLVEPFCGSAAVALAAASRDKAQRFWLNDANEPLMSLWREILDQPLRLAERYEQLWRDQLADRKTYFFRVREQFNQTKAPHLLLYLLARIVKGSVRYSADGRFNQSPDNRRFGMRPDAMRTQLLGVSGLLSQRTKITAIDFCGVAAQTTTEDVIYMDPPYQGTSSSRDHRYYGGLPYTEFVAALAVMNSAWKSYIISYDGQTGNKLHGELLPAHLGLRRLEIRAGRSSQSTLLGRDCETIESLYLSPAFVERLDRCAAKDEHTIEEVPNQRGLALA